MLPAARRRSSLRGYAAGASAISNSLLLQAEWRIMVNRFSTLAFFYDAGKVTEHASDLHLDGLKDNFGVGVRFHGPFSTPLRIELAKSNEGPALRLLLVRGLLRLTAHVHHQSSRLVRVAPGSWLCWLSRSACSAAIASTQSPRFYPDDPITREPESQDASKAATLRSTSQIYEMVYNLFVTSGYKPSGDPREEHQHHRRSA